MNNILIKIYETPLFFLHGGTRMFLPVLISRITRMFFFYTDVFITNTDFLFHEHGTSRKARKGSFYTDVFITNTDATRRLHGIFSVRITRITRISFSTRMVLFNEHGYYTEFHGDSFFCTNLTNHTNLFFYTDVSF